MSTGKGTLALYDIGSLLGADKPILFKAYPNHVFMVSTDVIPNVPHHVLWYGIAKADWIGAKNWLQRLQAMADFKISHLYEGLCGALAEELTNDVDYSKTPVPAELFKICTCAVVVHAFLHPDSQAGELICVRCGPNQLEVIAQAIAPRNCTICDRPFVMNSGPRNIIDLDLWKAKSNCKCDANFCKECLFQHIAETAIDIGDQKMAKCPGCKKPAVVTCYTQFLDHVQLKYEEYLAKKV